MSSMASGTSMSITSGSMVLLSCADYLHGRRGAAARALVNRRGREEEEPHLEHRESENDRDDRYALSHGHRGRDAVVLGPFGAHAAQPTDVPAYRGCCANEGVVPRPEDPKQAQEQEAEDRHHDRHYGDPGHRRPAVALNARADP